MRGVLSIAYCVLRVGEGSGRGAAAGCGLRIKDYVFRIPRSIGQAGFVQATLLEATRNTQHAIRNTEYGIRNTRWH